MAGTDLQLADSPCRVGAPFRLRIRASKSPAPWFINHIPRELAYQPTHSPHWLKTLSLLPDNLGIGRGGTTVAGS